MHLPANEMLRLQMCPLNYQTLDRDKVQSEAPEYRKLPAVRAVRLAVLRC